VRGDAPTSDVARTALRPGAFRRLALWWAALIAIGLLVALVVPFPGEPELLTALTTDRPPGSVVVATVATRLGDLWVTALLVLVVIVVAWRRRSDLRLAIVAAISLTGSTVAIGVLKLVTARARPEGGLVETFSSTFPSGHAGRAAAVYGLLVWVAYRSARTLALRVVGVGASLVAVAAIALSRVYLGVHWPSDVLTGVLLGSLWLAVVIGEVRTVPTETWTDQERR
jgi:membrane-associated phospholipid phosphatase